MVVEIDGAAGVSSGEAPEGPIALVVDDDQQVLTVHSRLLAREGYRVETASGGEEALLALQRRSFDVVVSDISMPGMSGIALVERIRASGNDVPVVLVTAVPHLDTAIEAIQQGVVRYLTKPLEGGVLARAVAEAVRVHGIARAKRLALDNEAMAALIEELNRAKSAAEAAARAKGEFLAKMSHELRSPLTLIVGMTELVLDSEVTDAQRGYLSTATTAALSLLQVIDNVLDVAALDRGTLQLARGEFALRPLLDTTLIPLRARALDKGLALALEVEEDVPDGWLGDPNRIRQVVGNLVSNAIKFTRTGAIKVRCDLATPAYGEVCVRFTVTDSGIGIAEEKHAVIFQPFLQSDDSATRAHGGAGLGLAIASQLVELMGGVLTVESTVGQGSQFSFIACTGVPNRMD